MKKELIVKNIVREIKIYCFQNTISLNEFSLRCGLTYSTIHNLVSYKTKDIHLTTLFYISYGMNLDLPDLITKITKI